MKKQSPHLLRRLIPFLLLSGVAVLLWFMLSHGSSPNATAQALRPHRLTVLTWNTGRMGGFMKPEHNAVIRYLTEQDADIICLQEVDVYKNNRYLTLQDVKRALGSKYPYSYIDFSIYNSRHQYGTMVWSRYPLIHKQSIRYESRGNLSNRCDVVIGKDTLRLINNHLESYSFTREDIADADSMRNYAGLRESAIRLERKWERALPLRNRQARMIRTEIEDSPYPVIVTGDFNSIPLSFAYRHISRGLHDAWTETSWGRWGATCRKRGIGVRIDYILSTSTLLPISCHVVRTDGSDHMPVVATLAW